MSDGLAGGERRTTATRWTSTPSSPMTPDQGFMASRAPAVRVAFSTKRKAMDLPSGDQAGCWMLPVRWVSWRVWPVAFGPEVDLRLAGLSGLRAAQVGEEGEGAAVGRPDGVVAGAAGGARAGERLCGPGVSRGERRR